MPDRKFHRKRYIAFEFVKGGDEVGRKDLAHAINERLFRSNANLKYDVILIRAHKGIVLTSHLDANRLREILNSFELEDSGFEMRTLGTSGTILTLKEKFFKGQDLG